MSLSSQGKCREEGYHGNVEKETCDPTINISSAEVIKCRTQPQKYLDLLRRGRIVGVWRGRGGRAGHRYLILIQIHRCADLSVLRAMDAGGSFQLARMIDKSPLDLIFLAARPPAARPPARPGRGRSQVGFLWRCQKLKAPLAKRGGTGRGGGYGSGCTD